MSKTTVFAGRFSGQPLVFAHLLDVADQNGLALDFDHVEVVQGDPGKRLAHVFDPPDINRIMAHQVPDETLVLIFAEALIPGARLFDRTPLLRRIGAFQPTRKRTLTG